MEKAEVAKYVLGGLAGVGLGTTLAIGLILLETMAYKYVALKAESQLAGKCTPPRKESQ